MQARNVTSDKIVKDLISSMKGLITAEELKTRIESMIAPTIIDVRGADEVSDGMIPGAIHLPMDEVAARAAEVLPNKQREVVAYCKLGRRCAIVADQLREMGYSNVKSLEGGYEAYKNAL